MSFKKYITCLYALLFIFVGATKHDAQESFFLEARPATVQKKKKQTLSALRNELADLCEDYAHLLIDELAVMSNVMYRVTKSSDENLLKHLHAEDGSLQRAQLFFEAGTIGEKHQNVSTNKRVIDAGWKVAYTLSCVQKTLLMTMRKLLEQDEGHIFIQAKKQSLLKYIEYLRKLINESKVFIERMSAYTNKEK